MAGLGTRIRDWFNGGDPDGRAKIRQWARGYDDKRPEGYTYGMMGPAMGLSVLAGLLYPLTRGYGSVVALALAVFLLLGRHMIERQVAGVVSDLQEARRQYGRTRNPEYLQFIDLRASGLLRDNKMLTAPAKAWLTEQIEWAREKTAKREQRAAKKQARAERRKGASRRAPENTPDETPGNEPGNGPGSAPGDGPENEPSQEEQ
ncbi:hypothetical protein [Actinomyces sp. oral taxon 414]|uniref:hypothetical protein n=1 Tax=Actinomyces sp. oral taxon 414 TaxID=712122 RepID=UPI000A9401F5|nr:hypothetical protein [Actinomyces sp. oral taxon 414]